MSSWIPPKTNWTPEDYFNVSDWDRIRGNLEYLRDMACNFFVHFSVSPTLNKNVESWVYANDLNTLEENLDTINRNTLLLLIGDRKTFVPGGHCIDYTELNRIELGSLALYNSFQKLRDRFCFCGDEMYCGEMVDTV